MYSDIIFFSLIILTITFSLARAIWFLNFAVGFEFKKGLRVELRNQRNDKKKWVIKRSIDNAIYSKEEDDFIYEPLPSNRTEEFINDTRFNSFSQAYRKYKRIARNIDVC